jgi:hypothetical protein
VLAHFYDIQIPHLQLFFFFNSLSSARQPLPSTSTHPAHTPLVCFHALRSPSRFILSTPHHLHIRLYSFPLLLRTESLVRPILTEACSASEPLSLYLLHQKTSFGHSSGFHASVVGKLPGVDSSLRSTRAGTWGGLSVYTRECMPAISYTRQRILSGPTREWLTTGWSRLSLVRPFSLNSHLYGDSRGRRHVPAFCGVLGLSWYTTTSVRYL